MSLESQQLSELQGLYKAYKLATEDVARLRAELTTLTWLTRKLEADGDFYKNRGELLEQDLQTQQAASDKSEADWLARCQ